MYGLCNPVAYKLNGARDVKTSAHGLHLGIRVLLQNACAVVIDKEKSMHPKRIGRARSRAAHF
jgi:hypothetical protein